MKIKNEVKIAIVAIIGIMVLFFGMQFLKGLSFFSSDTTYVMKFNDITGLSTSSPITANGFRVGTVKTVNYDYSSPEDIKVDVNIDKDMIIPNGTKAEIVSDMLGNVQIVLRLGDIKNGRLPVGGVIEGGMEKGAMDAVMSMVPEIQKLLPKMDSILTGINTLVADPSIAASLHNINTITSDLTTSTRQLNQIMATVNKELPGLTGKANGLLTHADGTMSNADNMITTLNDKVGGIDVAGTMAKVDQTLANVQSLTDKLNSNQGTLGLLMNDKTLYQNLTQTMQDADALLVDFKDHPKRYIHFSVFGKKDK